MMARGFGYETGCYGRLQTTYLRIRKPAVAGSNPAAGSRSFEPNQVVSLSAPEVDI